MMLLVLGLLAWAVADRISLKRRRPWPLPGAPPADRNHWLAAGLGLLLYVAFVALLHETLFGVSPLP
ncbi:MAG: hypothetical protein IT481_13085 [Gammaproteobacteria bacterium]|jgi:uncharacterized membrane protein|nr:hypothetical protein [Gammaproteobacteria bacterium]